MGSVGAALAGLRKGSGIQLPTGHYHNTADFLTCEIRVRQAMCAVKPFDEIIGTVLINSSKEISSHGIFIQLDAIIDIVLEMKLDSQASSTYKQKKGLLHSSETRQGDFIRSPVRQYLLKNEHSRFQPTIKLMHGTYTYPFKLVMPNEVLPAPFNHKFGELKYKLAVYMKNACCYQMLAEKLLEFWGYNNLSLLPNSNEPLVHESGLSSRLFSSKQSLKAVFTVEKASFLPKEEIVFVVTIINPKLHLIKNITACLAQRTVYSANWRKKITLLELNTFERTEMSNDAEIICVGNLSIPEFCSCSYHINPLWVYTVAHVIQYEIQVDGRSTPLKGEVEVIIGTTRTSEDELKRKVQRRSSTSPSLLVLHQGETPSPSLNRRQRSNSTVAKLSSISTPSRSNSLPPAYSQLMSSRASIQSIETSRQGSLPSHDEDVENEST